MLAGVAATDTDSAASFVAERVTLEDMRYWVCREWPQQPLQGNKEVCMMLRSDSGREGDGSCCS